METTNLQRKIVIWLSTVILFVCLFYDTNNGGMNWLIFGLMAGFQLYALNTKLAQNGRRFLLVLTIIAAFSVVWHGTLLSMFATIAVLLISAALLSESKLAAWEATAVAAINLILSPLTTFIKLILFLTGSGTKDARKIQNLVKPLVIVAAFGFLYYHAAPVFGNLMDSLAWHHGIEILFYGLLGSFIATVLYNTYTPKFLSKWTGQQIEYPEWLKLTPANIWKTSIWGLIILLGLVIYSDFYYRIVLHQLPNGLTYSEYLHQGVFALIVSIAMASLLSMIIRTLPSIRNISGMRNGLIIYMGLNAVLVIQTVFRNVAYVHHYGLTEKRVAVFVYLILCGVAVAYTIYGLLKQKRPTYLYRQMGWATAAVLVISATFNWSIVITKFNLAHVPTDSQLIDYNYLLSLNESNLPILKEHRDKMPLASQQWYDTKINRYGSKSTDFREFVVDQWVLNNALSTTKNSD